MNVKAGGTTMNKWKEFAEMLGIELEQEFVLTDVDGNRKDKCTYKITENGIFYKSKISEDWIKDKPIVVEELLNGCIKVVAKPWKPKKGEEYWYYSDVWKEARGIIWEDSIRDLSFWKAGNCFRTDEEAATKGKEIVEQIRKEYKEV